MTLSGSFANATGTPTEVGFYWGTSSSTMTNKVKAATPSGTSGSFTANLTGLTPGDTYVFQAYAVVPGSGIYASQTATINAQFWNYIELPALSSSQPAVEGKTDRWELPGATDTGSTYEIATYYSGSARNYTHLYDKTMYTSMWTAYRVRKSLIGTGSLSSWEYSPKIDEDYQVNLCSHSYNDDYSRGHLIPNASRNGSTTMQEQTYYVTNSVPQVHNGFNNGIWSTLEGDVRQVAKDNDEEIYVVTGVAFSKVGENRTIKYTTAKDDTKQVPVPNYFYKLVLRVKMSGSTVTDAYAVGFWFENKVYSGTTYTSNIKSVNEIEQLTGFDFFVNLPDTVEEKAENYTSCVNLKSF